MASSLTGRLAHLMKRRVEYVRTPAAKTVRRPALEPPKAVVAPTVARTRRTTVRAAPPTPSGPGEVVQLPEDSTVISDILARARFDARPARSGQYLHVSDLLSKCTRKVAIIEQQGLRKLPQRLGMMDLLTFAVGDTIHDVIKSRVANGSPGQIWGNWKCQCGTTATVSPVTLEAASLAVCPACHSAPSIYVEVPMRDEELLIVGTPDLLILISEVQAFFVSELKSIAHDAWKELSRPLPDHVLQVVFYWYLMRKLGYKVTAQVSIVYVTKGYIFAGSPYKEFTINAEEEVHRLEPYIAEAISLKTIRASGGLPARTMCASDRSPDAKKCEVCSICFNGTGEAPVKISIAQALRR